MLVWEIIQNLINDNTRINAVFRILATENLLPHPVFISAHYSSHGFRSTVVMIFTARRRTLFMLCLGSPWAWSLELGGCGPSLRLVCPGIYLKRRVVGVSEQAVALLRFWLVSCAFIQSPRGSASSLETETEMAVCGTPRSPWRPVAAAGAGLR